MSMQARPFALCYLVARGLSLVPPVVRTSLPGLWCSSLRFTEMYLLVCFSHAVLACPGFLSCYAVNLLTLRFGFLSDRQTMVECLFHASFLARLLQVSACLRLSGLDFRESRGFNSERKAGFQLETIHSFRPIN